VIVVSGPRLALIRRRRALGFSQEELAKLLHVNRSTVARWERGTSDPQPWNRPSICHALKVDAAQLDDLLSPEGQSDPDAMPLRGGRITLPAGRQIAMSQLSVNSGSLEVAATTTGVWRTRVASTEVPGRTMITVRHPDRPDKESLLDGRGLRGGELLLNRQTLDAYIRDAVTLGIIWVVAGYEAALLDDDADLAALQPGEGDLLDAAYDVWSGTNLSAPSRMFAGSRLCAAHITRHLDRREAPPVFWTREQQGEEGATWLLFRHKFLYLLRAAPGGVWDGGGGRAFCIPAQAVAESPLYERVLMLLVIGLMESMGIRTWISSEPDFGEVDGFALVPGDQAVIASWARVPGEPTLGVTRRASAVRGFTDVVEGARVSSVNDHSTPAGRLAASCEYLGIDRAWVVRRCAELASVGIAGLARPRSRHLSLEGVETAVRYIARALDTSLWPNDRTI
jgi:L-asparaginase